MVNGIGRVQKLGRYNRQRYVVTNRPLSTTLPYSNSTKGGGSRKFFWFFADHNIQCHFNCRRHPPMSYYSLISSKVAVAIIGTSFFRLGFGAYCSPSCTNCPWTAQNMIYNIISPYPPNPYSFIWSNISLAPPPQLIRLYISQFCARRLCQTQPFP